jgi:hypothetical protein
MTALAEVARKGGRLRLLCRDSACATQTPLDPRTLMRRDPQATIAQIAARLVCPACGGGDVEVTAVFDAD